MVCPVPLIFVLACAPVFPGELRTPRVDERAALDQVALDWQRVSAETDLTPLSPECAAQHERLLVLVVDGDGLLEHCGFCEPGTNDPKTCIWGEAYCCPMQRGVGGLDWPIAVVHQDYDLPTQVAHESVHLIGHCLSTHGQPTPHSHDVKALWSAGGVFPL